MSDTIQRLKQTGRPLVLFGAGFCGAFVLERLRAQGVAVAAFADNVLCRQPGAKRGGLSVRTLEALQQTYPQGFDVLITVRDIAVIVQQLREAGIEEYATVCDVYHLEDIPQALTFMEREKLEATWYTQDHYLHPERLTLDTLDLVITERCSLKCKECANLMQFYEHPEDYDVADIRREMARALLVFDEIYEVRLLGGEPFMHRGLAEIITYLNEQPQVKRVCIYTNATILPNDEQMAAVCAGGKTWFSVSNYGALSRQLAPLIALLEAQGIGYERKDVDYWTRCASFAHHDRTAAEKERVYYECCAKDLVNLVQGRLSPCPFIANALQLGAIPEEPADYVDLFATDDIDALRRAVQMKLRHRRCFRSCDWCTGRPAVAFVREEDKIAPHEQVKQPLPFARVKGRADR